MVKRNKYNMMDNKLVINEKCDIEIPKAHLVIKFDGEKVQLALMGTTELVVDGDFRIGTTGNFEVISKGDAIFSTSREGKVRLGYIDKIREDLKKKEIE